MAWFRCDDRLGDHPKVMHLDEKLLPAMGLWLMCGVYCSKHLTDGFVPRKVVRFYDGDRLAKLLEAAGLFEPAPGGWLMHDYLHWNPSKDDVATIRAKRRAAGQAGGQASASARAQADSNPVPVPGPIPVSEIRLDVPTVRDEWVEPADLYRERTRRRSLSQKEQDWLEDLHARFSRMELVRALQAVEPGPDYLRRVDEYLEAA
jgi:hypothetical protein